MENLTKIVIGASIASTALLGTAMPANAAPSTGASVAFACGNDPTPFGTEREALLTAGIESIDHENRSAVASGTGEPGAIVAITGPTGELTTIVATDGKWSLKIAGLAEGMNFLPVTQDVNGVICAAIILRVIIHPLETPIVDPIMAGGVGMLALALAGGIVAARRKQTARQ